ncbi:hypothetical protein KPL70_004068 [Citrus sinensis]|uniref:uncharacterized protein LOC102629811 n=1 Tax=Citrus sinensis TaxID=2711 RepID=UPI0003D73C3D|nr:uncharacterized protein LOC102629811 [Citrus sinensis]XP_052289184.1 uncharacterized protein LOC102629811 [Citrus sinensis]KAH9745424.1 hypothetical protein KPL70_004068 [Citrus sinensis]
MKVAPKLIFLLRDPEGLVTAIADALHSNPSSSYRRLEESFELSLEQRYGIKEQKARGQLVHFIDDKGNYQVSVLLLQNYEPPALVCAISEVLAQLNCETSTLPLLLAPFVVESSKLKGQEKSLAASESKVSLYGLQIGLETDITQAMAARTQKAPSSLQIHCEPLACFLQLVRILKSPTFILIGQRTTSHSNKTSGGELQILHEMGDLLASNTGLSFRREKIIWNPAQESKDAQEPWRALYG